MTKSAYVLKFTRCRLSTFNIPNILVPTNPEGCTRQIYLRRTAARQRRLRSQCMCRISNHSICHDGFGAYIPLSTDIPRALLYTFVMVKRRWGWGVAAVPLGRVTSLMLVKPAEPPSIRDASTHPPPSWTWFQNPTHLLTLNTHPTLIKGWLHFRYSARRVSGNNKGVFIMSQRGGKRGRFLPSLLYSFCKSSISLSAKKNGWNIRIKSLLGHS